MIEKNGSKVVDKCAACGKLLTIDNRRYLINNKIVICSDCYEKAEDSLLKGGKNNAGEEG